MKLRPDQAKKLQPIIARDLRFLGKLCKRLQQLGVSSTDPVWIAAQRAYDGMHFLSVELHYTTCDSGVARDMEHLPDCLTPPVADSDH